MLSKDFTLTPALIDQIIEENVGVAQNPKNNNFGSGRIDALASINAVPTPNTPPNAVVNPSPSDTAENIAVNTNLSWMNGGGAASYEVSFGTDNPPTNIVNGEAVTSSNYELIELLEYNTIYYWSINAINDFGNADGPIWSFTTAGPADEDFETGDFTLYPWAFAGNQDWIVQANEVYEGTYSAKSGLITHDQTSELEIVMNVEEDDIISFYTKISCEEDQNDNWDYLAFYIDSVEQDRWDGEVSWGYQSYDVTAGNRTFKWKYLKDGSVSSGSDCAWLDYITFPSVAPQPPVLVFNPEEFAFEALLNEVITDDLTIENTGSGIGTYSIELIYTGDWLELDSYSGDVEPDEIDTIELTIDPNGLENGDYSAEISITDNRNITVIPVTLTVDMVDVDNTLINANTLVGNHPNPFNPSTTISFSIADQSNIEVSIYSIKGQKINTLVKDSFGTGVHTTVWNGNDDSGEPVSSGVYFYKLNVNGKTEATKKMLLLK
ncbi:MAG: T9SS type A sorting domain-containing protein [Candidatus Cloacimonetes bacterium]|nr:T9SS type A sorting domain-containing protein [Candidatus Cloacimonadota bacterium]